MSIRYKILLVVLPLLIPPLLITGVAAALSARNGITAVGQEFLQFKAEELARYAGDQWQLLLDNELAADSEYVGIAQRAIETYAGGMVRRESELILAVRPDGSLVFAGTPVDLSDAERMELARLVREHPSGWHNLTLGGENRVAQSVPFDPFEWVMFVTERESVFYRTVRDIARQTGVILAATIAGALLLLFLFTRNLLMPLSRMAVTIGEIISAHDLSKRVPVLYRDEIGDLGHTFNVMAEELGMMYDKIRQYAFEAVIARRQEQKIRNVFQKYVPIDVIDQFFANPESMLVGQNRTLAVLFSDIRSFSTIAERLPPEQIVESLNSYFSAMVDIVIEHGGIVDKYIGDAIMAFFGAPVRRDNDAAESVNAALDMLAALETFNRLQHEKGLPRFQIGIGINYGPVTIGNIGSEKKMDYTVVGDMVNLASRLEGLTKIYRLPILISESVYQQIESQIECRLVDTVTVKGKSEITRIYSPVATLNGDERRAWDLQQKALDLYYQREFVSAARYLLAARKLLPGDTVIRMFLVRCKRYIDSPPGDGWNGVTAITAK